MRTTTGVSSLIAVIVCVPAVAQPPEQWQAFWVWGSVNQQQGPGYFRLSFEVDGELDFATLQGSGDDGYSLSINGAHVRDGGFGFNRTDVTDALPHLRQGKNVIACLCRNAAFPGGFLAQLQLVYADGRQRVIVSDRQTRFSPEEIEGWTLPEFDDSDWEQCEELTRPPGGAWGPLPLEYAGRRGRLKLVDLQVPEEVAAGETLRLTAIVSPTAPMESDEKLHVRILRDRAVLGSVELAPQPASSQWQVGQEVALGPVEVGVNRFLHSGPVEVEFSLSRCTFEGVGDAATRTVQVTGKEGTLSPTPAHVADCGGAPALYIAGKPAVPMMYLQGQSPVAAEYGQMAAAGYYVFSLGIGLGWQGDGVFDYRDTDNRIATALEQAPDAYVIPRVHISAPTWWCMAHPEQVAGYADGTEHVIDDWGGTRHESFASALWREDAGAALRSLIAHFRQSPYADRIVGYHIATGIYGEWHLWSPPHLPDTSEPMRQAFIAWATERYEGEVAKLNAAWGTQLGSFADITCATEEERMASDLGVFKDLSRSRRVADYWQCLHETTVDAIEHFCGVAKEATDRQAVTGVFYAYLTDIGWPQEGGHLAAHKAYQSPDVDFFSSPHSYSHRAMGEDGAFRAYPASIQAHGKLFIDEGDDRTHLSGDKPYMHAQSTEQDIAIMRRETLNALSNRTGLWWFDMTTGWFNDPELLKAAAELHDLGERTLARPRHSWTQIAVVFDPTTYYAMADWKTDKDALCQELCNQQFRELQRIGAPYDVLLLQDALAPEARDYRCYVFLNTWHMTAQQREQLTRLQAEGRSLVFAYAPGFSSDEGLRVEHMSQLTGMSFEPEEAGGNLQARWSEAVAEVDGLEPGGQYGPDKAMAPRFRVVGEGATPLAEWVEGGGAAAAVAAHEGWTSFYSGTGRIPAALLAEAARRAGVHLWTDAWRSRVNLWAGNGLLGVHTAEAGPVRFSLPAEARVTDAITGEVVAEGTRGFEVDLGKWQTAIYALEPR